MPGPLQRIELAAAPGAWTLTRADPPASLAGLVKEFWEVRGALAAFRETLLPNGCLEVMVNLGPPHRMLSAQGEGIWNRAWFSGLHERSLVIESLEGTHLVSARLTPAGGAAIFGTDAAAAANAVIDLEEFLGAEGESLAQAVKSAAEPAERFQILEAFLVQRHAAMRSPPPFVLEAAARIEHAHGNLRVASLHESSGVSRKHLAVSFPKHIGVTTKAYSGICRFTWTLEQLRSTSSVDWSHLAFAAGYSDQSHLVRDFRRVGAESPTTYLRIASPDKTALLYEAG
jgi:methylphosphotriester-DNA--protein-cysteine methyltransferase